MRQLSYDGVHPRRSVLPEDVNKVHIGTYLCHIVTCFTLSPVSYCHLCEGHLATVPTPRQLQHMDRTLCHPSTFHWFIHFCHPICMCLLTNCFKFTSTGAECKWRTDCRSSYAFDKSFPLWNECIDRYIGELSICGQFSDSPMCHPRFIIIPLQKSPFWSQTG